jgi:hypothetical protein
VWTLASFSACGFFANSDSRRVDQQRGLPLRSVLNIAATVSLSLLLAAGASAEAPSAASTNQTPEDQEAINIVAKRLCRGEPVVGTRIAFKRKCDTPAQLAQYQRQAREIIEEYRHRPCMMGTGAGPNDVPMQC